jgi:hypothetical protein
LYVAGIVTFNKKESGIQQIVQPEGDIMLKKQSDLQDQGNLEFSDTEQQNLTKLEISVLKMEAACSFETLFVTRPHGVITQRKNQLSSMFKVLNP